MSDRDDEVEEAVRDEISASKLNLITALERMGTAIERGVREEVLSPGEEDKLVQLAGECFDLRMKLLRLRTD